MINALAVASDLELLKQSDLSDLCREDSDFDYELFARIDAWSCRSGEEACCAEAGFEGGLFHVGGDDSCSNPEVCGTALSCTPNMMLLENLNDTDFIDAMSEVCRVLGRDDERHCHSVRIHDERVCQPATMCRKTDGEDVLPGTCADISIRAAECSDDAADEAAAVACMSSMCEGLCQESSEGCIACETIVGAFQGQHAAGWSFDGIDVEEAVYDVCQYTRLRGIDHPEVRSGGCAGWLCR
jgi:hypothetical protein